MLEKLLAFTMPALLATVTLAGDDSLEPCINGEVSRSGDFASQVMQDQVYVHLQWQTDDPHQFRVAARKVQTAYPED